MGDERTDADHVQIELPEEFDVLGEARIRLPRDADHHAAAHLVPETAERPQDREPVGSAPRQRSGG